MKDKELKNYIHRLETCVPKIMRGLRMMRKGPAADGLNLSQELILISLLQNGKSKMSDLSESTGINATALTAIVDGLFNRELIIRKRDSKDRSIYIVCQADKDILFIFSCHGVCRLMMLLITDNSFLTTAIRATFAGFPISRNLL